MNREAAAQSLASAYTRGWTDLESLFSDASVSPVAPEPPRRWIAAPQAAPQPREDDCSWLIAAVLALVGGLLFYFYSAEPRAACDCSSTQQRKQTRPRSPRDVLDPSAVVPQEGVVLVFYHAAWCSHCARFKPVFDAAAAQQGDDVDFLAVEDDVLRASPHGHELAIQNYPTTILFENGKPIQRSEGASEASFQELLAVAVKLQASGAPSRSL